MDACGGLVTIQQHPARHRVDNFLELTADSSATASDLGAAAPKSAVR
jgi:hypothetical protein